MALIACTNCHQKISSLARFCPKCENGKEVATQKTAHPIAVNSSNENSEKDSPPQTETTNCALLLTQQEFKPYADEMILLQGPTFLISAIFNITNCYAYLTSKRYVLTTSDGPDIVFQVGMNDIIFAEEGRNLICKKIILTTTSGTSVQIKCKPHGTWFNALKNPKDFWAKAKKTRGLSANSSSDNIEWFYEANGMNAGPVKETFIVQLIQNNHTIYPETKVWNATLPDWKKAEETILTIYFSGAHCLDDNPSNELKIFRLPGLSLLYKAIKLFRKYL